MHKTLYETRKERICRFRNLDRFKIKEEFVILEIFNSVGLYPVWQHQIGRHIADFVFEKEKICIELDGWYHKVKAWDYKHRDEIKDKSYKNRGWKVIRIKYNDLENEWDDIKGKILDICDIIKEYRFNKMINDL